MGSKKSIPDNLKKVQDEKRKETLKIITDAIDEIQFDNGVVTKKRLMEITELSNATFSKPHVKELLKEKKVCQFRDVIKLDDTDNNANAIELKKLQNENEKLKEIIESKDLVIEQKTNEYVALDDKYRRLLGKTHQLMKLADIHSIDFSNIFE